MKLLIDMNLSPSWVLFFQQNGFNAVHWSTVGAANASDAEIMAYAEANQFVIFTHDLDFGALLAVRKARGPSVIQIRTQDVLPSAIGSVVLAALQSASVSLATGALVTIELQRHRIRVLPI